MDEGRERLAQRNAEDEGHGNVMRLLFAGVEARRLVIFEMKPTSSANNFITWFSSFVIVKTSCHSCCSQYYVFLLLTS